MAIALRILRPLPRHLARRSAAVILIVLLSVAAFNPRSAERYGDTLQVVLPLMAWGCQIATGQGAEFVLRYTVMFTLAHGSKIGLGDHPVNQRPDGGTRGFPSAHTSTAVLGASALVHECLRNHPVMRGVVILAAGFVGASRIEAGRHDIWQVLAGALLGWSCDRAFRRPSPLRRAIARAAGRLRTTLEIAMPGLLRNSGRKPGQLT